MTITDQDKIKLLDGNGLSRAISQIKKWVIDNFFQKTGGQSLPVENGGTGAVTLTENGVVLGNGTNAVKTVASTSGALYSTGSGVEPQFGVLPVAQGGTGLNHLDANFIPVGSGNNATTSVKSTNANEASTLVARDASGNFSAGTITANLTGVSSKATAANITSTSGSVAYYTNTNGTFGAIQPNAGAFYATGKTTPTFGTLPVNMGGTGATTLSSGSLLQGNGTGAVTKATGKGGPITNGFQTVYVNSNGVLTAGVKILYGSSLPSTFSPDTYPAGTIFIVI